MKRFVIFQVTQETDQARYKRSDDPELSCIVEYNYSSTVNVNPMNFPRDATLYRADNHKEAVAFAMFMTIKHPGSCWSVAETSDVFQSRVGPIDHSKFDERGLFPA